MCKKKQKDEGKKSSKAKIGKVEEELSDNSETETESDSKISSEGDSSSEDTSNDEQNFGERCGRVREINIIPIKKNKRGILIAKLKDIKPKDGKTIEFEMTVNRCKLTAILDTGTPITKMPRSYRKWIKPSESDVPPVDRKFVDLNGQNQKSVQSRDIPEWGQEADKVVGSQSKDETHNRNGQFRNSGIEAATKPKRRKFGT